MAMIASDWLGLAVLLCIFAWAAKRQWIALSLPFAVLVAAAAVYLPTGSPRYTSPPKGDYQLLGADIQVDVAIYALLKPANGPAVYYKLPYSTAQANALQEVLDGAQNGQGVQARVNGEGGVQYDGPPPSVTSPEPKQPEQPAIAIP